jgi:cytochrome b561
VNLRNSTERWGAVSQLLHWLIVGLIVWQGIVGLTMGDLRSGPDKVEVYALHKSFGLTLLGLVLLRLAWRVYAGAPEAVPGVPTWQARGAALTHFALYVLLFALPLSGWVLNSAAGYPLPWFGVVNLPAIAGRDHALHELAEEAHAVLFWILVAVAVLHSVAAIHHHLFRHDPTLARMLPRGWLRVGNHDADTPDA